jgi:hypothetical protein
MAGNDDKGHMMTTTTLNGTTSGTITTSKARQQH